MKFSTAIESLLLVGLYLSKGAKASDCQCYQGVTELEGEWTSSGDVYDERTYGQLKDDGECGFVKVCNDNVVQLILSGETYFAIDYPCRDNSVCAIDEFEINNAEALVHGGNAQITQMSLQHGWLKVKGTFIAGPDDEQDPHPGRETFYSHAQFAVHDAYPVECPSFGRGCD